MLINAKIVVVVVVVIEGGVVVVVVVVVVAVRSYNCAGIRPSKATKSLYSRLKHVCLYKALKLHNEYYLGKFVLEKNLE